MELSCLLESFEVVEGDAGGSAAVEPLVQSDTWEIKRENISRQEI